MRFHWFSQFRGNPCSSGHPGRIQWQIAIVAVCLGTGWARMSTAQEGEAGQEGDDRFSRMDANGDGQLDLAEVSPRMKFFFERTARQAGLDPTQPVPLDKLREVMGGGGRRGGQRGSDGQGESDGQGGPGGSGPGRDEGGPGRGQGGAARAGGFGFGNGAGGGNRPGGLSTPKMAGGAPGAGASRGGAPGAGASRGGGAGGADASARFDRYASSLIGQYDKNKDGKLQESEWGGMRGNTRAADKDGDKVITKEELVDQLSNWGKPKTAAPAADQPNAGGGAPSDAAPPPAAARDPRPSRGEANSSGYQSPPNRWSGRKSFRARTPTERLPQGLPDWFARNDADGDGQVKMSEYSRTWSDTKAEEFNRYDHNGDGVVTPAECLKTKT